MGNALILASVTAVLKNLLENGMVDRGVTAAIGQDATISATPPDRVIMGPDEKIQLNLFLYQAHAKGLFPTSRHDKQVSEQTGSHGLPRSLEMQYLLTAYGAEDLQAEILLGYALELFHAMPVLTTEEVRRILTTLSAQGGGRLVPPARVALADPTLPNQIKRIKICPQALQTQEMVNLWSAFQVSYRPSISYRISVDLAEDAAETGG